MENLINSKTKSSYPMIEMDEAFEHVIRHATENGICGVKVIPLSEVTFGQVLAEDVIADQNHP